MTGRVFWALPPAIAEADSELVARFDAALEEGERRAAGHVACRVGCTECCMGAFDITALDAARLLHGLAELARTEPAAARGVRARAAELWGRMGAEFPGDVATGVLSEDDGARTRFFARFADRPCPALDPHDGSCAVYRWRPLSCRTFGLPVRFGPQLLAPCTLNFTSAGADEVAAATVEPDPDDREGRLLELSAANGVAGDTTVAAAIATAPTE